MNITSNRRAGRGIFNLDLAKNSDTYIPNSDYRMDGRGGRSSVHIFFVCYAGYQTCQPRALRCMSKQYYVSAVLETA
jgi:hypothetical protein